MFRHGINRIQLETRHGYSRRPRAASIPVPPHFCLLDVDGWRKSIFIASQMGHTDAKMVYEVYGRWIGEMDRSQIDLLNSKLHTATPQWRPIQRVSNIKGD